MFHDEMVGQGSAVPHKVSNLLCCLLDIIGGDVFI
jgi:hypothetical protein